LEDEYGTKYYVHMYGNEKAIPVGTVPGMQGSKGEWWRGMNSSMIYSINCKNLCKCHSVPLPSTTRKEKI
jgi:hypothetical protein